jgi:hypothetical protein
MLDAFLFMYLRNVKNVFFYFLSLLGAISFPSQPV